ncbi:MAG: pyrroline-5-carboxylate reductase [Bacteroidia bacterium]|nr:pyrroline-5-carboxylate reductase [Bacteroidia bacterium]MDW8334304.1 pyrroline-5-carboxylate reductase [Bacteroidia bacterium]
MNKERIAIVGCGNMGLTYARTFLQYDLLDAERLLLVEKNDERKQKLKELQAGRITGGVTAEIESTEIIFLCVKPQDFPALAPTLRPHVHRGHIIVSVMAGIKIKAIESALGAKEILRLMPNLPVQVGMGASPYATHPELSAEKARRVERLLGATGIIVHLEDERLLDAVTALSGSGPAYFFYILKAFMDAGTRLGLEPALASLLARQTMLGSYHLLNKGGASLDDWIGKVASRGGTTEAALKVFEESDLNGILVRAVEAAEKRAAELSEIFSSPGNFIGL